MRLSVSLSLSLSLIYTPHADKNASSCYLISDTHPSLPVSRSPHQRNTSLFFRFSGPHRTAKPPHSLPFRHELNDSRQRGFSTSVWQSLRRRYRAVRRSTTRPDRLLASGKRRDAGLPRRRRRRLGSSGPPGHHILLLRRQR